MANVNDYTTGKILTNTKQALFLLKLVKIPIIGFVVGKVLLKRIRKFEPKLMDLTRASRLIQESKKCAIGERVCRAIHKNSEFTESVFLDELAEGMIKVGKAGYVTKEDAIGTLKEYSRNHTLILSKISNKPMEICCSSKENCVYLKMERAGLRCLNI